MRAAIVTTSWDDGHVLDVRLAALLKKYGVKGTFYVSPRDREFPASELLTEVQVADLSKDFEIGAHTMTHPQLPLTADDEAQNEITESKKYLEKVTGGEIKSFCYPRGQYEPKHVALVREAGYSYARTTSRHSLSAEPLLESPTTIHAYDHWSDIWPVLKMARFNPFIFFGLYHRWDKQAIYLFDHVHKADGVFHLWGHSWEIDTNHDWDRLERVLKHIGSHADVQYQTNGQLI